MTDIEIAQAHEMKKIVDVAAKAGIDEKHLELYGNYKAKIDLSEIRKLPRKAKLILVTAISPTPAGEGKTTTSVGLADALNKLGKNTMVCLREPSLGAEVGGEAGFRDGVVAQAHRGLSGLDGVAAVGDVCERAAVDERGSAFERLDHVGLDGIL